MDSSKKTIFDIGWVFSSQIILSATTFFISIILGRFLGPAELGIYSLTISIYIMVSVIGGMGIANAIVKFVAESQDKNEDFKKISSSSVILTLIFGILSGLILIYLSGILSDIFSMEELNVTIKIAALSLPFLMINNTLLGIFNGLREMKIFSIRAIIRSLLLLGLTISLLIAGFGIYGVVFAVFLSETGIFLILLFSSKDYFSFNFTDFINTSEVLLKFSSHLVIANIIWILTINADKVLIGFFLTDTDVGIYTIVLAFGSGLILIPGALSTVLYPMISQLNKTGNFENIASLVNKFLRYSLFILSFLGLILILFSKDIILILLNQNFLAVLKPLWIYILGIVFFGSVSSIVIVFRGMGKPDLDWKMSLNSLIVGVILNIILIPAFGIIGAVIGTISALLTDSILTIIFLKKYLNIKIKNFVFIKAISCIILPFLCLIIAEKFLNYYIAAFLSILGYLYSSHIFKLIKISEIKDLIELILKEDNVG